MAQQHLDVMHKLLDKHREISDYYRAYGTLPSDPYLSLSSSEIEAVLEIFEKVGLCTKDGQDVPRHA